MGWARNSLESYKSSRLSRPRTQLKTVLCSPQVKGAASICIHPLTQNQYPYYSALFSKRNFKLINLQAQSRGQCRVQSSYSHHLLLIPCLSWNTRGPGKLSLLTYQSINKGVDCNGWDNGTGSSDKVTCLVYLQYCKAMRLDHQY